MGVYLAKLPANRSQTALFSLMQNVSSKRKQRIQRYRNLDDGYRTLIGELLLRYLLKNEFGYHSIPEVETNRYGKPFIRGLPFFHYNISHSGDWVALGISRSAIGIDIEKIAPFNVESVQNIIPENEYLPLSDEPLSGFYEAWTLKESYVKAIGRGLSVSLSSFKVKKSDNGIIELIDKETHVAIPGITCSQYHGIDGYKLSMCVCSTYDDEYDDKTIQVPFSYLTT